MDKVWKLIKRYRSGLIIVLMVILFMILYWFIRLSDIRIDQEQVIESESNGYFIARYSNIDSVSVALDEECEIDKHLNLEFIDSDNDVIGSYIVTKDSIIQNGFGKKINISGGMNLRKGDNYRVAVYYADKQLKNVSVMICGDSISILSFYLFICTMIIFGFIVLCFCFYSTNCNKYIKFILIMIVLGLINNFVIKPLNVPDETTHLAQSYELANRIMRKDASDDQIYVYQSGIIRSTNSINTQDTYHFWTDFNYGSNYEKKTAPSFFRMTSIPLFCYLPGAIGIVIARILRMPYQFVILLGRMSSLLFFSVISIISMHMCYALRYVIAAICFLPSTVWIVTSYSYDTWNLAWIILFVSLCFRIREQKNKIQIKDVCLLVLSFVLFAPAKIVYVVIGLSIMFVPHTKWNKKAICIASVSSVMAMALVLIMRGKQIAQLVFTSAIDTCGVNSLETYTPYTFSWVLQNPVTTFLVYFKTIWKDSASYIRIVLTGEMYNEPNTSSLISALVIIIFILFMTVAIQEIAIENKDKIKALVIVLIGDLAVYTAFLFSFSIMPVSGIGTISGVQGRYFIPYIIFLPVIFNSRREIVRIKRLNYNQKHDFRDIMISIIVALNLCIMFSKFVQIALNNYQYKI